MENASGNSSKRTPLERQRKRAGLSQAQLADSSGISQSTISRIERGIYSPGLDVFAKLARAMDVPVSEVAPEAVDEINNPFDEVFYAFCSNLVCDRNQLKKVGGSVAVTFRSYTEYPLSAFDEVNFCTSCGEQLIKQCPSCTQRLKRGAKFCEACGTRIVQPSPEQWAEAERVYEARNVVEDDDIPF